MSVKFPKKIEELLGEAERLEQQRLHKAWESIRASKISLDLWQAAFASHARHILDPRLKNHSIFTLIDFRLPSTSPRLWVVRLTDSYVFGPVLVSHGKRGSFDKRVETFCYFVGWNASMVGAYATFDSPTRTPAGQTKENKERKVTDIGLQLYGLDPGLNSTAFARQVIFHGAWYVNSRNAGDSEGCFATSWVNNRKIIELIKGGTFVYAFAGSKVERELLQTEAQRRAHEEFWRSLDI